MNKTNSCTEATHKLVNPLGRLTEHVLTLSDRYIVIVVTQAKSEGLLLRSYSVGSFSVNSCNLETSKLNFGQRYVIRSCIQN
jgi:hypothetical protein